MDKYNLLLNNISNNLELCIDLYRNSSTEIQQDLLSIIINILSTEDYSNNRYLFHLLPIDTLINLFYIDKILIQNRFKISYVLVDTCRNDTPQIQQLIKLVYDTWALMEQNEFNYWTAFSDLFFLLNPTPEFEQLFNNIYDAWVDHKITLFNKDYRAFTYYFSIIEKYRKINFKNLSLNNINIHSKLTLEEIIDIFSPKFSFDYIIRHIELADVRIQDPITLFSKLTNLRDKKSLCYNQFLTSDQILTLYNKTKSSSLRNILLTHSNAPDSFKIKLFLKTFRFKSNNTKNLYKKELKNE